MIRPKLQELSQHYGLRMEETLQQESEYKNPNEDQGGIRHRLRDRDLLRKRKAEAEEKETNQLESQRKRSRGADKSGTKKRGRPRKTEPTPQISIIPEEAAVTQESPAIVVVPEPAEVIPDQIPSSLTSFIAVESQPTPVPESVQSAVFAPTLIFPAPVNPAFNRASVQDSALDTVPVQDPALDTVPVQDPALDTVPVQDPALDTVPVQDPALDTVPVQDPGLDTAPVQDSAPAPDAVSVPALYQYSIPAVAPAPPSATPLVETLYTQSQGREALNQVLIEDLGPDEEEDAAPSQDKGIDKDLSETLSINAPEQNKIYSLPTLSSPPVPQEYLPGN